MVIWLISLTQGLLIELSILLPTLHVLKLSKIEVVHLILQAFVKLLERSDITSGIEIHENEALPRGVRSDFEQAIDGFVEVGDIFESRRLE